MKRYVLITALLIALGIIISLSLALMHPKKNKKELVLYGNVDVRQVDIGFRVAGQVEKLLFEEGDKVVKGSLMATLDKTPYDNEVRQAQATVDATIANLDNAEKLLQRRLELIGIGGVSQEDLDNSLANRDELTANLVQAKASLAIALDNMAYTKAFAPTDGIILTRIREPGTVVNPANPVYTLSVSSPVWIRAFVDEPDLGQVYYGMNAEIYTDIEDGEVYTGKVGFISPVAEFTPKTVETTKLRTDLVYRLRIYADNPDHFLVQGMPVTVKLKLKKTNRGKSG
ncbi:MAG: efflux RND transporter periplasmic adaptor subunit [Chlamydiales bacterium]|nr:efflux RND transporter periplasmic adaptor subunit [Chlamydiales bacterium]